MKKYWLTALLLNLTYLNLFAQQEVRTEIELRGQIMTDMGYNFNQMNPDYFDVMRPTQLPAYKNQYGSDGNTFFGVRQSMLDVISNTPTRYGPLTTRFAFDLFGVGIDAGRTTFHMLYAYAEVGKLGFGHTWSLFCDFDAFPRTIDYWGPVGLSLCKNAQVRFIPFNGRNRLAIALERPGASTDQGVYRNRIELTDVTPHLQYPDLSAEFRATRNWGYVELAGVVRKIGWEDLGQQPFDLSGSAIGWGFNLSTNLKIGKKSFLQALGIVGSGIENFMNDAPADIAVENDFSNPNAPIKGVALPVYSYSAYFNHSWNDRFSSAIGYSSVVIDNSDGQSPDAFRVGRYASTNLLYYPFPNAMAGIELQWINRENNSDGWKTSATKIQVSMRYFFKSIVN